ncbi:hypothetical protein [Tuwongella immobilis]|uniref:hypothetical protein n=1 Tax=Tuwongella immobilis TaxID=692036 RepID=UPI0013A70ACA|nr:hypothetical protein [Tuwongella immobilis]
MTVDASWREVDICEGLFAKIAAESPEGADIYFTPRELIKAVVDCVQSTVEDTDVTRKSEPKRFSSWRQSTVLKAFQSTVPVPCDYLVLCKTAATIQINLDSQSISLERLGASGRWSYPDMNLTISRSE